jgi:hypothetical protein
MSEPILYIECDLPDGVGLLEWRAARSDPRSSRWERVRTYVLRVVRREADTPRR